MVRKGAEPERAKKLLLLHSSFTLRTPLTHIPMYFSFSVPNGALGLSAFSISYVNLISSYRGLAQIAPLTTWRATLHFSSNGIEDNGTQ